MVVQNFKESRESLEITQATIAKLCDVDDSTVSGWETEKDIIPLKQLIKYANEYHISLDYLFGLEKKNLHYEPLEINLKTISNNLRKLRKENSLTQDMVAKKLNTSQSACSNYERGIYLIPTTFLYNLTIIYKPFSIDKIFKK